MQCLRRGAKCGGQRVCVCGGGRVWGQYVGDSRGHTHSLGPEGADPEGEKEAAAHAGQVENSLSHHKPHREEDVRGREEGDDSPGETQRDET